MNRRSLLRAVGAGGLATALAGCADVNISIGGEGGISGTGGRGDTSGGGGNSGGSGVQRDRTDPGAQRPGDPPAARPTSNLVVASKGFQVTNSTVRESAAYGLAAEEGTTVSEAGNTSDRNALGRLL